MPTESLVGEQRNRVEFRVEDLPPKKDGANSMWAKAAEVPRLIALRRAALAALKGRRPFCVDISLELEVHCPASGRQRMGDLDNFVTGICDGLMAADPRVRRDPRWEAQELMAIHPSKIVGIEDDDAVVTIHAKKVFGAASAWYRVAVEGE
jgi:hypothetical protein